MKNASLRRLQTLVVILADGKFHSGEYLASQLEVSRTAIWKLTNKLQSWGIDLFAVRGKGYKIPGGLTLIDGNYLQQQIEEQAQLFSLVEVLSTIDSTSSFLTKNWSKQDETGRIVIAEHQTEGRGRSGKAWISPFGCNLYFSLGINLPMGLSALGGLSLAIGIGLTKLLNKHVNNQVKLKWPNDLLVGGRKLAGILVEASGDTNDKSFLNIGIGINWEMSENAIDIDQPWINLSEILSSKIDRNELLGIILLELDKILLEYITTGFESFRSQWAKQSAFYNQSVNLHTRNGIIQGIEVGIDKSGALILRTDKGDKCYYSGEVSMRSLTTNLKNG